MNLEQYKGKRIAGIDFGLKRVGISLSDIMHITISPKTTLDFKDQKFRDNLSKLLIDENVGLVVIGFPFDSNNAKLKEEIDSLFQFINDSLNINIVKYDEYGTSKTARSLQIESGVKKKKRSQKGNDDRIAASVILKEFLDSNS